MASIGRIDTHAHVVPRRWKQWAEKLGYGQADGMPAIPAWSAEDHLTLMDKVHIDKCILSVSSPGTHLCHGEEQMAAQITREANVDVSQICADHPSRFGFFASLPLPDVDSTLEEIDYALDELGALGFVVMSNAHGYYMGDPQLRPVFEKLNARHAVVFIHPTQCHVRDAPSIEKALDDYPAPMMEFVFDTARAVTDLLLKGTVTEFPNVSYIISHGGAVLPPILERVLNFSARILKKGPSINLEQAKEIFSKQFHFDLAGFPFPDQIHGLLRIAGPSRLVYGSDFPYTPGTSVEHLGQIMDTELSKMFDTDTVGAIYSGSAKALLEGAK